LVVPTKSLNKAGGPAAEAMEGSGLAKGNSPDSHGDRTPRRVVAPDGIERVRQAAKRLAFYHPRQEPDAVVPHVRIRGGGAQRWAFLLRLLKS
jgi:hypothetical protein